MTSSGIKFGGSPVVSGKMFMEFLSLEDVVWKVLTGFSGILNNLRMVGVPQGDSADTRNGK